MSKSVTTPVRGALDVFHVEYHNIHLFQGEAQPVQSHSMTETAEMIVFLAGGIRATWEHAGRGGEVDATAGDVILWPGGATRVETNSAKVRLRCLCVYFHWLDPIPNHPVVVADRQRTINALAGSMLLAKDSAFPRKQAILNSLLAAMLAEYLRLAGPLGDELVERTAVYIQSHLRREIYLEDMAGAVGLEKSYFCRRYRALTGRSPMQDVRRMRAEHAAGILRSSPHFPLKDIAGRVGVRDEHQLSKLIRRYLGVSARELRARVARDS